MGLLVLVAGLVVFLGAHMFVTKRAARARAIARLGLNGYRVTFGVVALAGLLLIGKGFALYRATGWIDVWYPPHAIVHVTALLMLFAVLFVVAAYTGGHLKAWLRHPMLTGIKTWAFAHLLANGDLGSIILFGSFLAWAVYARIAAKRREAVEGAPAVAVAGYRADIITIFAGVLIYLALALAFHPVVIGVPVFGRF